MIQAASGFFTYFVIMNDYGFKPDTLIGLANRKGVHPVPGDKYMMPNMASIPMSQMTNISGLAYNLTTFKGNSAAKLLGWVSPLGAGNKLPRLDWNGIKNSTIDVRLFHYDMPASSWAICRFGSADLKFWYTSSISG